jgi:uncharacterized protein (TIGR00369 family)
MPPGDKRSALDEINRRMRSWVPHNRELGLVVTDFSRPSGVVWMTLPYSERLVGNPDDGVLHGGAITTLMDAACGMAVMVRLGAGAPIATLDLRIDYLKPAVAGRDVVAHTECFKITRHIAFVRGLAHTGDENDPIAAVAATFMRKDAP